MHDSVLLNSLSVQSATNDPALDPSRSGVRQGDQLLSSKPNNGSFYGSSVPAPLIVDKPSSTLIESQQTFEEDEMIDKEYVELVQKERQSLSTKTSSVTKDNTMLTSLPAKQRLSEIGDDRSYTQNLIAATTQVIPNYKLSKNCGTCAFSIWDESCKVALCVAYNNVPVLDNYVCDTYLDPMCLILVKPSVEMYTEPTSELVTLEESIPTANTNSQIILTDVGLHQQAIDLNSSVSDLSEDLVQLNIIKSYRTLYLEEYGTLDGAFT